MNRFESRDSSRWATWNMCRMVLLAAIITFVGCVQGRFVARGEPSLPFEQADGRCQAQAEAAAAPQWGTCELCALNTQSRVKTSCMAGYGYEWVK